MKFHFEPALDHQLQAIEAVVDLFRGQEKCQTEFTVVPQVAELGFAETTLGVGNRLALPDEDLYRNLTAVQIRNKIAPSRHPGPKDFTVEMETGTGKTYVYLRTIIELSRRYGFTKFVIVVPSIAIREGVYKSLQVTDEHFRSLYGGMVYEYFVYDSRHLGHLRNFASSRNIQIMVVTIGSINRPASNNFYKPSERLAGQSAIDIVSETRPILIVDEPQSVDGGRYGSGKRALDRMNPLFTLRYSATHTDKYHMVYRLDPIGAYEHKLVKQIEVAAATVQNAYNRPYVKLLATRNRGGSIIATIEMDVESGGSVRRDIRVVRDGDDLEQTAGRAMYRNCSVGEITVKQGHESLTIRSPHREHRLLVGHSIGDVDIATLHRQMMRRTIAEHLHKEIRLRPLGIKVLSLFFLDSVASYRDKDERGELVKGPYATMFEEEYLRAIELPEFRSRLESHEMSSVVDQVHGAYFSVDRQGIWRDTAERNKFDRECAERAYQLIMRDKEKLLQFNTPLRFIFSHSALREGWDNPNVFQICNFREISSNNARRQFIGRGLRLCVNESGYRVRSSEINTLTIIAREDYQEFARNLQREIEQDTGVRFGSVDQDHFVPFFAAGFHDGRDASQSVPLDLSTEDVKQWTRESKAFWIYLRSHGFVDQRGRIQDNLRLALQASSFDVPEEFSGFRDALIRELKRISGDLDIRNADERRIVRPRQCVLDDPGFRSLWDRIKTRTTYRVHFDCGELVESCARELRVGPVVPRTRLQWRVADIGIADSGVETKEKYGASSVVMKESEIGLPDILTELQDRTQLTRASICAILLRSGRLEEFRFNPQKFIQVCSESINRCRRRFIVDGIKYEKLQGDSFYSQQLFLEREITSHLKNMKAATKSAYEYVVFESNVEADFADELERDIRVKVYAKLPSWFVIPTPLGSYNPDWAILLATDEGERLYFVVETKSSLFSHDMRSIESAKIRCGHAHFLAIRLGCNPANYRVATSLSELFTSPSE